MLVKHIWRRKKNFIINQKEESTNYRYLPISISHYSTTVQNPHAKPRKKNLFKLFALPFMLDPNTEQIIPDLGNSSGSDLVRIHNTA